MDFSKMSVLPMKVRLGRVKVSEGLKNSLKRFLVKYFDLPSQVYIDDVLKRWTKGFVRFFFDVLLNGFLLSVALVPFYYFFASWRVALFFLLPLGVASWVFRNGVDFLKGRRGGRLK